MAKKQLTVEDIRQILKAIEATATSGDDESAHDQQDDLYEIVLEHIANIKAKGDFETAVAFCEIQEMAKYGDWDNGKSYWLVKVISVRNETTNPQEGE